MPSSYLLTNQYKNSINFNKRIFIWQNFSVNKYSWIRWMFDQLKLPKKCKILELGCGPGNLWFENINRIPKGWDITLSDFSPGMIKQAKKNIKKRKQFTFKLINALQIPFKNESFDVIIANHMLYHVPNLDKTLSEVKRVLKPNGTFYAATNGKNYINEIGIKFGFKSHKDFMRTQFSLKNGKIKLKKHFSKVNLLKYQNAFLITQVNPLLEYIESKTTASAKSSHQKLKNYLTKRIKTYKKIKIPKSMGVFIAKK